MKFLIAVLTLFVSISAYSFTSEGFYKVDDQGWIYKTTPIGDVFICKECPEMVQVQISVSDELDSNAKIKNDKDFVNLFGDDAKKKEYAENVIRKSIPLSGVDIKIIRIGNDTLGGSESIRYSAFVSIPDNPVSRETSIITFHKNRIYKFTANFYEGKLSETSALALERLQNTFSFL